MGMNSRHEQTLSDTVSALSYSDTLPGLCHYRWQGAVRSFTPDFLETAQ